MAMGKRQHRERQEDLWVAHTQLAAAPGHPFYERLNAVLDEYIARPDEFECLC
jgi:hypothetical protein